MGWEERKSPEHVCLLPDIPWATKEGDVWKCDICDKRWVVYRLYYGHDVMPGEPASELKFKLLN